MKIFYFSFYILVFCFLNFSVFANGKDNDMKQEKAIVAGGCFWCVESAFDERPGIIKAVSGYTGGTKANPSYEEVSSGSTGHYEAVEITYNPEKITYNEILNIFWRQIDPTDSGGQFADKGSQYKTAIFYLNEEQKKIAEESKKQLNDSGYFDKPIAVKILPAGAFYTAEDYHQDYYKKQPDHYKKYRIGSGREAYIEKTWKANSCALPSNMSADMSSKKPADKNTSKEDLRKRLSSIQFYVTQENGTERPFNNEYWDNHKEGIYVDIVSGEALFSSSDKFDSGSGWPSFTKPIEKNNIVENEDSSGFMVRTEVRSKNADSHLGHVFDDGPKPLGTRYCINSASLKFIPKEELDKEGYGEYKKLFEKK